MSGDFANVYVLTQTDFVLLALIFVVCVYVLPKKVITWIRGRKNMQTAKED